MDDRYPIAAFSRLWEGKRVSWITEFEIVPSLGVAVTGGLLILLNSRRLILGTLAVQYLFVARLTGLALPLQVAAAKVVDGFMA